MSIASDYRAAREELRDGMAALANCAAKGALKPDGTRAMPQPSPVKIVIEKSPWPAAEPRYLWTAYYEGYEDELSKAGATPEEALGRFLNAIANADEPEID